MLSGTAALLHPLNANVEAVGSSPEQIVVFLLEGQRYGLRLGAAEHVLPAVELTVLPRAPAIVLGIFSLRGEVVPVVDVRERFRLRRRAISPDQQMVVVRTSRRRLALLVDATVGVIDLCGTGIVPAGAILNDLPYLKGVARTADGLVLIQDLDTFLSLDEAAELDAAMSAAEKRAPAP